MLSKLEFAQSATAAPTEEGKDRIDSPRRANAINVFVCRAFVGRNERLQSKVLTAEEVGISIGRNKELVSPKHLAAMGLYESLDVNWLLGRRVCKI